MDRSSSDLDMVRLILQHTHLPPFLPSGEFVIDGGRARWLLGLGAEQVRGEDGQSYEAQE